MLNRPDAEEITERNWMPADQCLELSFLFVFGADDDWKSSSLQFSLFPNAV